MKIEVGTILRFKSGNWAEVSKVHVQLDELGDEVVPFTVVSYDLRRPGGNVVLTSHSPTVEVLVDALASGTLKLEEQGGYDGEAD